MFDESSLTFEAVSKAIKARGLHVADLDGIWNEAEDEVDKFTGF